MYRFPCPRPHKLTMLSYGTVYTLEKMTHQLDGELSAGRAVVLAVAGMACGMCAWMDTRARFAAFGRPRTAGNRRVHDHRSTRTRQLVEAHARTRLAVSAVA